MFGLLQPDKEIVGRRLKEIKDGLNISFTEFGNRLGLKKPTINSYVQGYNLAPLEVIEKVAKFSDKSVGWLYFGEIDQYIADYLALKGQKKIIEDHSELIEQIKNEFFIGSFKNPMWENEVGYPAEEFIDDYFSELESKILQKEIAQLVKQAIDQDKQMKDLSDKKKVEAITVISADIVGYIEVSGEIKYDDYERITELVKQQIEELAKKEKIEFHNQYLVGKLINVLDDDQQTAQMISELSQVMTGKSFSTFFGGDELVEVFQSMRPALMKLYSEKSDEEFYEWFEK